MSREHGITEQQWFQFLEDLLPAAERARIEAHIKGCEECRQLYLEIRVWEGIVQDEAKVLVSSLNRSPEEIDRLAVTVLDQIRKSEPSGMSSAGFRLGEAVLLLRALIDPLCGRGAAQNAVRLAAAQLCAPGEQSFSPSKWSLFVTNLGSAIGTVYGLPARMLIERVGHLVTAEVH